MDGIKGFSMVCIIPPQTSVSTDVSLAHCAVTIWLLPPKIAIDNDCIFDLDELTLNN